MIDSMVADLSDSFADRFAEQVQVPYGDLPSGERQALVWRALHKRGEFVAGIQDLRDDLVGSLGATRSTLVRELNIERDGLATFVGDARASLVSQTNGAAGNLAKVAGEARGAVSAFAASQSVGVYDFYMEQGKLL